MRVEMYALPKKEAHCVFAMRLAEGSLAEFASADANKVGIIFRGDMCLAKNTFRGADCASKASAGSAA